MQNLGANRVYYGQFENREWRLWKIGKLVFFSVSVLFPLLLPSKWKGSGIWQHICNKKVHFTSKKLPHTLIQCEPRQRVNHKAYQYSAVFGENQEESDQLHLRKVPSVCITCFKMFFWSFLLFCSEILLSCINFHGYLLFGSYFWKHLRHFCWRYT